MKDCINKIEMRRLSVAVSLACAALTAQAQTQMNTQLLATGSYRLDSDAPQLLQEGPSSSYVNVISFPGSASGSSSAVLHSYGSSFGDFGSRSSGYGSYDVTGSFQFRTTLINETGADKQIIFHFHITPGLLSNDINSALSGSEYLQAGMRFDIQRDGHSVWSSQALLRSDSSSTGQFSFSGANLYSGSGLGRTIAGGDFAVDLGVLAAGQALDLQYDMATSANGQSVGGTPVWVPEQRYTVPDQWVDYCGGDCGYGYGHFEPAHEVVIPGYWSGTTPGGSHASSGDPFFFDSNTVSPNYRGSATLPDGTYQAYRFDLTTPAVPEPSSYALLLGGLAALTAWTSRRRSR